MATINQRTFEFDRTIGTVSGPFILELDEAASQTYLKGAVLALNSSGYVIEAASANPSSIIGVALEPGKNTSAAGEKKARFMVANQNTVFSGSLNTTSDRRDVGKGFQIVKTGNLWLVDKAAAAGGATAANKRVLCIGHDLSNGVVIGDTNPRIFFIFFGANSALTATS